MRPEMFLHKRMRLGRPLRRAAVYLTAASLAAVVVMMLPPLRNTLLPFWPRHWRDVSSVDVLRMYYVIRKTTPLSFPEKATCSSDDGFGNFVPASWSQDKRDLTEDDQGLARYLHRLVTTRQAGPLEADLTEHFPPDPSGYFKLDAAQLNAEVPRVGLLTEGAYNRSVRDKQLADLWLGHSADRKERLGGFLPALDPPDVAAIVRLLFAFDLVCRAADIRYLVLAGSMLGVYRHHGLIPWDDDVDVGIDVTQADAAFKVLSCIPGYTLRVVHESGAQWKLFRTQDPAAAGPLLVGQRDPGPSHRGRVTLDDDSLHAGFPFLDIFLFTHDERHVWALATFTFAKDLVMATADVVPFVTSPFEGGRVPVAGRLAAVLARSFDLDECVSPDHDRKKELGVSVTRVKCQELSGVYNFFHS